MRLSPEKITSLQEKFNVDGIDKVKHDYANSTYGQKGSAKSNCVEAWIEQQESIKANETQARSESREEQNIELAREANKHSKFALLFSGIAVIVSVIGVLIAYFKT